MTKIRFIKRAFAETEGRGQGVTHEEGTELDLPFTSAFRWIRRGYAVELPLAKAPGLRLNRPMMGGAGPGAPVGREKPAEAPKPEAASANGEDKPKRRGRKPAAKKGAG